MAGLHCTVVTPEATVLDDNVEFVVVPLFDGELGIADRHSPMIGRLGYGELRLKSSAGERRYYVDGGFVQVADNVVSVLTSRALPAADIDVTAAQRQLDDASTRPSNTDELADIRDRMIRQARAMIRVGKRGG